MLSAIAGDLLLPSQIRTIRPQIRFRINWAKRINSGFGDERNRIFILYTVLQFSIRLPTLPDIRRTPHKFRQNLYLQKISAFLEWL